MRLHEAKALDTDTKLSLSACDAICESLCMVTQAHLWHWQTKSDAEHRALGAYYETLQGQVDELAELFMGAGGTLRNISSKPLNSYEKNSMRDSLSNFRQRMNKIQATCMEPENVAYNAFGDQLLDIVKETDKLLYLLTLE